MRTILSLALAAAAVATLSPEAQAQSDASGLPAATAVNPVSPEAPSAEADPIRTKIQQAGVTDIDGLTRESTGVWRATGRKGGELVRISVDKGGRIKTEPQR